MIKVKYKLLRISVHACNIFLEKDKKKENKSKVSSESCEDAVVSTEKCCRIHEIVCRI